MSTTFSPTSTAAELQSVLHTIAESHGISDFDVEANGAGTALTIALLGEFSSGKSTLANALLGKALLPAMEKPTTAAVVEIVGGSRFGARVEIGGVWQDISLGELGHYIMGPGAVGINKVAIEVVDNPFIGQAVHLVDTPGISSLHESHSDITYGYLPMVDAAFVVMDINKGGVNDSILRFLREKIASPELLSRFYFVLNLADTVSQEQRDTVLAATREQLAPVVPNPRVIILSAKQALEGEVEKSGIQAVHTAIDELIGQRAQIQEARHVTHLRQRAAQLKGHLKAQAQALAVDNREVDAQLDRIRQDQDRLQQDSRALLADFEAIRGQCQGITDAVVDRHIRPVMDAAYDSDPDKLQAVAQLLSRELGGEVEARLRRLNVATALDPHALSAELHGQVAQITEDIRNAIDLISPLVSGVAIAALTGPAGLVAAEVATASAGVLLAKTLAKDVLQRLDLPGMTLKLGAKTFQQGEVATRLKQGIGSRIALLLEEVELTIRQSVRERFELPLAELERSLEEAVRMRAANVDAVVAAKTRLQKDIARLDGLGAQG
ncbi:GTPase Era [compost metagenome]